MVQVQLPDPFNAVVPVPSVAEAIRTANHQAVQNREEDGPLYIELETAPGQQFAKHFADAGLLPETLEDQGRPDPDRLHAGFAAAREDQHGPPGKARKGADQGLDAPLGLEFIHAADGGDDLLADLALFLVVGDDLQVVVLA